MAAAAWVRSVTSRQLTSTILNRFIELVLASGRAHGQPRPLAHSTTPASRTTAEQRAGIVTSVKVADVAILGPRMNGQDFAGIEDVPRVQRLL